MNKWVVLLSVIPIILLGVIAFALPLLVDEINSNQEKKIVTQNTKMSYEPLTEFSDNQTDSSKIQQYSETFQCKGKARCISGFVTRIIDGDTIVVDDKSIRFSLVNTPEWGANDYSEAGRFIENICPVGSKVLVDEDDGQQEGSFGRIIGKIFCNKMILNEEILEAGHAKILTKFCPISAFSNENWAQKFGC